MAEKLKIRLFGVEQLVASLDLLAQAAEGSLEVRNALVDLFGCAIETAGIDIQNGATSQAGELWIEAKLPNRLAALAVALRAGDLDAL